MDKRRVSLDDLVAALQDPKSTQKQKLVGRKPLRIGIIGRNGVTVIFEEKSKVIITVYNYRKEYYKTRAKQRRNKNRLKALTATQNNRQGR